MIETPRLRMRSWRDDDVAPFQTIFSDPRVMATLGPTLDLDQAAALLKRLSAWEGEHGYTYWALERRADARLIGWCGAIYGDAEPVLDKIELGWTLAHDCWGAGYAGEAAQAAIDWLFANRPDDALWAVTSRINDRSRELMERIGMHYHPELDFDHPKLAEDDPLRPHMTYSLSRETWGAA